MVSTFRQAGIIWYRDYGFDYEWMTRAKGNDKSYGGWPFYPKIVKTYEDNGVRVLADLKTAIKPPTDGRAGPDINWTREIMGILTAFPSVRHFELDNEYDLNTANAKAEEAIGWRNYGAYHKKFGELTRLLGDGKLVAVENGRAGIWPGRLRQQVQSGAFASLAGRQQPPLYRRRSARNQRHQQQHGRWRREPRNRFCSSISCAPLSVPEVPTASRASTG
jgi:hypothetical protein